MFDILQMIVFIIEGIMYSIRYSNNININLIEAFWFHAVILLLIVDI